MSRLSVAIAVALTREYPAWADHDKGGTDDWPHLVHVAEVAAEAVEREEAHPS